MLKMYRLYVMRGGTDSSTVSNRKWVDDFDARNSDHDGEAAKNAQAESDMFAFMEKNKGVYFFEVIYISEGK